MTFDNSAGSMTLKTGRSHNIAMLLTLLLLSLILDQKSKAWGASVNESLLPGTDQGVIDEVIDKLPLFDGTFNLLSGFSIDDTLLSISASATELTPYLCRQSGLTPPGNTDVLLHDTGSPQVQEFVFLASYKDDDSARNRVDRHIYLYTTKKRKTFATWLQRSGRYLDTIKAILKEDKLPADLVYLPLIESGYSTDARSSAHAVGPWQFIESTGKSYGLKTDYWRDERRDPIKSTVAAARYLKDLYNQFGSWSLALAAYNAGEGNIRRALRKSRSDNYWRIIRTRYLKRETRNYVSKFIAAGIIASEPEKYGFTDIDYHEPLKFEAAEINSPVSLSFIAKCTDSTVKTIRGLNPELKRWCTPPDLKTYRVRVPEGTGERFSECFNSATPEERMPKIPYIIKKGDTLWDLAKSFHFTRKELYALNKGINPRRLRPGSIIFLPPTNGAYITETRPKTPYIIKKGDTLWDIAKRLRITRKELYALNKDINPERLRPGSIIYLPLRR
ncbi:MAG TPA: LysM peptidoglycan-binding domain-containing protein [Nitrospirae bacterium]|nr:LysM peptidoglycan-binding domain-containing protein [Nitrospirota bacterium]